MRMRSSEWLDWLTDLERGSSIGGTGIWTRRACGIKWQDEYGDVDGVIDGLSIKLSYELDTPTLIILTYYW